MCQHIYRPLLLISTIVNIIRNDNKILDHGTLASTSILISYLLYSSMPSMSARWVVYNLSNLKVRLSAGFCLLDENEGGHLRNHKSTWAAYSTTTPATTKIPRAAVEHHVISRSFVRRRFSKRRHLGSYFSAKCSGYSRALPNIQICTGLSLPTPIEHSGEERQVLS